MIIRADFYQNTGLSESDVLHQLEILLACTDPARNLRELVSSFQALIDRIPVLLAVQKKFTLTDQSFRTAQLMQIVIDRCNLLRCIRSLDCWPSRNVVSVIQIFSGMLCGTIRSLNGSSVSHCTGTDCGIRSALPHPRAIKMLFQL